MKDLLNKQNIIQLLSDVEHEFKAPFIYFIGIGLNDIGLKHPKDENEILSNQYVIEIVNARKQENFYDRLEILFERNFIYDNSFKDLLTSFYYIHLFDVKDNVRFECIKKKSLTFSLYTLANPKRWKGCCESFFLIDVEHGVWNRVGRGNGQK
jgi:hypothetical protein